MAVLVRHAPLGDAWMEKCEGSYVLHLKGSPYETGYQHGALLADEIDEGAVRFSADVIAGGRKVPFSLKTWFLRKFLDWKVYVPRGEFPAARHPRRTQGHR